MEKNFEKLSIEEMSLVSGGTLDDPTWNDFGCALSAIGFCLACASPFGWVAGTGLLVSGAGTLISCF